MRLVIVKEASQAYFCSSIKLTQFLKLKKMKALTYHGPGKKPKSNYDGLRNIWQTRIFHE